MSEYTASSKYDPNPQASIGQAIGKTGPFSSIEQETFISLLRTVSLLMEPFDALFKAHGLSEPQYNALRILRGHGRPIPSGTVAAQMVARDPDITRLLDRLAKAGFVERTKSDKDKRVVLASITDEGLELLNRLDEPVLKLHRQQFGSMSEDELKGLNRLLAAIRSGQEHA